MHNVSLSARRGEFLAILGAGGSGKSTLLNLLAGADRPDRGRVSISGIDLARLNDAALREYCRRLVAHVPQHGSSPMAGSVLDVVARGVPTGDEHWRHSAADRRHIAADWIDRIGLADRMHHASDALDAGGFRRMLLARALATPSRILLVDDPTAELDAIGRQVVCQLLRDQSTDEGRTVVIATQDAEAAWWADRVIVMSRGRSASAFLRDPLATPLELSPWHHTTAPDQMGDSWAQN